MTFGEKLQELRRRAGMSQDALAEKLEVSRQAVSKWERDETMPETEKVVRIAQLFGVSLDYLLMGQAEKKNPEPENPTHQTPNAQDRSQFSYRRPDTRRAEQFIRRHGFKAGYVMMAVGAVICVLSLLAYWGWYALGGNLFSSFGSFTNSVSPQGGYNIQIDGDIPAGMKDEILDALGGSSGSIEGDLWSSTTQAMQSTMNNALKAQASLFLIGLVPGLALLIAGAFIVVKGKKMAAS